MTRPLPDPPERRPLVFAGPGVIAAGAVEQLRRFAARGNVGVANSYTAKGLFRWDDPHHYGTVGLQQDDFALAGFGDADCIVAVGVDDAETPRTHWALAPVVDLEPEALGPAADAWPRWDGELVRPPLFERLASVIQPLYTSDAIPLAPPRAIADIAAALAPGDRVLATPGLAAFWLGRAFPTTEPGSVLIGPGADEGVRVAVTDGDPDAVGGDVVIEAWGREAEIAHADEHGSALREALVAGGRQVVRVPVDFSVTRRLVDVAGPIAPGVLSP